MVSSNGKEQVSDGGGKEKRKWNGGGGNDDKTGRSNRDMLRFWEDHEYEDFSSSDDSCFDEELFRMFEERDKDPKDGYEPKKFSDGDICVSSSKDPTTWKVECMFGRERYSAFCLMQKYVDLDHWGTKVPIISAVAVDHVKGFIFVEAEKQSDIHEACKGISDVYSSRVTAVPSNEVSGLLSVRSKSSGVSNGMYKGDLRHVGEMSNLSPSRKVNLMTQSVDHKRPTYAKKIREDRPSFFQGNLAFKAERKSQAFEKTILRDSHRREAPASARYLSGQSTPAWASPSSKRSRRDTTQAGGFGKKPVREAEGPAAGSVSVLGWDPEKVERTRDYVGRRPPFQISFLRALLPNQTSLDIHPSVGAAMDACAMAWTEELGSYASTMAATELSVCSAILQAQASVFNWEAHHLLMEDQKKYAAAQQENKKRSKKMKKYTEVIQDLSEQLTKARKKADLAEKVVLEREKLQREVWLDKRAVIKEFMRSAEYNAELRVAYVTAFQIAIQQVRDSIADDAAGPLQEHLADYLTENPLPENYLELFDNLAEYTPAGFVDQMRPAPPIKLMSVDAEEVEE